VGSVHGRFMNADIAVILVCGLLNLIPWLLLAYFRPDREIEDKVETIDLGLATIAQALFVRLENLENLATSATENLPENPFASMLAQLFQQRIAGNDLYGRSDDGTFDGTTLETEVLPSETEQP
jgi:ABC-type phosphate transport system auxiliary subunit